MNTLELGGMKLVRRLGGVDIESNSGDYVRLQNADLKTIILFLKESKP